MITDARDIISCLACSLHFRHGDAETVEPFALLYAVRWGEICGFGAAKFLGHCLSIIQHLISKGEDLFILGNLFDSINFHLKALPNYSINFVSLSLHKFLHLVGKRGSQFTWVIAFF